MTEEIEAREYVSLQGYEVHEGIWRMFSDGDAFMAVSFSQLGNKVKAARTADEAWAKAEASFTGRNPTFKPYPLREPGKGKKPPMTPTEALALAEEKAADNARRAAARAADRNDYYYSHD